MLLLSTRQRVIALLLLATLPAIGAARLSLDARTALHGQPHVETEHNNIGAWGHDHRLCVLVFQSPWSPAVLYHAVPALGSGQREPLAAAEDDCGRGEFRHGSARAPPHSN